MKEWRLKPPKIQELRNAVQVTIPHAPLATPEEQVLEFLESNAQIRNRDARAITGIKSENKMKRVFHNMKELNKPFEFFHDLLWADLGERPRRPMAVYMKHPASNEHNSTDCIGFR